jgi:hypothetical protein
MRRVHQIPNLIHITSNAETHKALVKENHTPKQIEMRLIYCNILLELRPNPKDWRCVLWCDEIHWMTGPKYQKDIKRDPGDSAKYAKENIQYEKDHKLDPSLQTHFYIYCVLGWNFAFAIPYNAGNKNGKMNTRTYINVILPALRSYILHCGGDYILWQDRDSAHISEQTLRWMDTHGMPYIISASKSPDTSIMETWVSPIRRKFYSRKCSNEKQGVKRFYEVLKNLDQDKINRTIDAYPKRLKDIRD